MIVRKCPNCREYFPVEPMSLKFFCDKKECQNSDKRRYIFGYFKNTRGITSNRFDIWDDERIISDREFERVCRVCGAKLETKKGVYSPYLRYCQKHRGSGYELFVKYNWSRCCYTYENVLIKKQKLRIIEKLGEYYKHFNYESLIRQYRNHKKYHTHILCEECGTLCNFKGHYNHNAKTINVHHIKPVYSLTIDEFDLIWDHDNLIALCEVCHHEKHKAAIKPVVDMFENFKKITEFI